VVEIRHPDSVQKGEEFDLTVVVVNESDQDPLTVDTIDIGESYLEGFAVTSTEPSYSSSMTVPIDNSRSFEFGSTVGPGATNVFIFHMRAQRKGRFIGDIDVCEGLQFLTQVADTVVE